MGKHSADSVQIWLMHDYLNFTVKSQYATIYDLCPWKNNLQIL